MACMRTCVFLILLTIAYSAFAAPAPRPKPLPTLRVRPGYYQVLHGYPRAYYTPYLHLRQDGTYLEYEDPLANPCRSGNWYYCPTTEVLYLLHVRRDGWVFEHPYALRSVLDGSWACDDRQARVLLGWGSKNVMLEF